MFDRRDLAFDPGIFSNRSKKASRQRWVDGDLVRFTDGPPQQRGGWLAKTITGGPLIGKARAMVGWRPLGQAPRYAAIGTHQKLYLIDSANQLIDITPAGLVTGPQNSGVATGYGSGAYGAGAYGGPSSASAIKVPSTTWTLDLFGAYLVACYRYTGQIFRLYPGEDSTAEILPNAPSAKAIGVTAELALFAVGCDGDPTLVKWSERANFEDWDVEKAGARAGFYQMDNSTEWQCTHSVRGLQLAWTLTETFAFTPTGNAIVYSRERLADQCGVAGPNSVAVVTSEDSEIAFWMGEKSFFIYDGLVRTLPCDLHDYVFKDINLDERAKFWSKCTAEFQEVEFHYCSAAAVECDRAVVYCYANGTWSRANLQRLAGVDKGVFDYPMEIDGAGIVFDHERGQTANGAVMASYVVSHPLQMGSGVQNLEVDAFWPDLQEGSTGAAVTFICRQFMGDAGDTVGPFAFAVTDEKIDLCLEARYIQVKISGTVGEWEVGLPAASVQATGGER